MRYRPTVAEINGYALAHNVKEFVRLAGNAKLMAVVKADAYGHGAPMCARIALANGAAAVAVATAEEALELRRHAVTGEILVLGAVLGREAMEALIKDEVAFPVYSMDQLEEAEGAAERVGKPALLHIKLETGFNRIGMDLADLDAFLCRAKECSHVELQGMFTHFATADEADDSFVDRQYRHMLEAEAICGAQGVHPMIHVSNSAAITRYPDYRRDMVRLGISLYGCPPSDLLAGAADLWPVMSLKSAIVRLREAAPGEAVGYGCTYRVKRPTLVATLPIGYADGYPRLLSNRGQVLVGGKRCPVIGRVCMDQMMVDVSGITAHVGDPVVLLGKQGSERITADELAELCGTISHEILTGISGRVPREFVFDFEK